ncbi:MAG: hypothetical protein CMP61_05225 [Flavobacteriales bacterium]|nr:hypothetical protein [Flavobacteriales bacterium]|tara:strand:+ start:4516 stop:5013 length:498 start_codon:yes stop_codon:yes gene_type:complete
MGSQIIKEEPKKNQKMQKNVIHVLLNSKLIFVVFILVGCKSSFESATVSYIKSTIGKEDSILVSNFEEVFPYSSPKTNNLLTGISFYDQLDSVTLFNFIVLLDNGKELRGNINKVNLKKDNKWVLLDRNGKKTLEYIFINGKLIKMYKYKNGMRDDVPMAISDPF